MQGFEVLLAALALLLVPVLAGSRGVLAPRSLSLLGVVSTAAASVMVVVILAICSAALVQDRLMDSPAMTGGRSMKHLIPGIPSMGWASLALLWLVVITAGRSMFTTSRRRRALRQQLAWADIHLVHDVPVATVATDEFVAAAVPGHNGCVVISDGALRRLTDHELRAVLHHEEAHLLLGHHRHLLLARTAERSLWFIPGMRQAVRSLKTSLELAADASARQVVGVSDVRSAIAVAHRPDSSIAAVRWNAVAETSTSRVALAGAWLLCASIGVIAIALSLSWLGTGL